MRFAAIAGLTGALIASMPMTASNAAYSEPKSEPRRRVIASGPRPMPAIVGAGAVRSWERLEAKREADRLRMGENYAHPGDETRQQRRNAARLRANGRTI